MAATRCHFLGKRRRTPLRLLPTPPHKLQKPQNDINLKLNTYDDLSSSSSVRKQIKDQLIDNSNQAFQLIKIYNAHQDQIREFVRRIRSLRGSGLKMYQAFDKELLDLYNKQSGSTKEYAKKILLGLPTDTQEYPLRKMKNDILKQVGM